MYSTTSPVVPTPRQVYGTLKLCKRHRCRAVRIKKEKLYKRHRCRAVRIKYNLLWQSTRKGVRGCYAGWDWRWGAVLGRFGGCGASLCCIRGGRRWEAMLACRGWQCEHAGAVEKENGCSCGCGCGRLRGRKRHTSSQSDHDRSLMTNVV